MKRNFWETSGVRQTGGQPEQAGGFYGAAGRCAKRAGEAGFDFCPGRPSLIAAQSRARLGRPYRRADRALAASRERLMRGLKKPNAHGVEE